MNDDIDALLSDLEGLNEPPATEPVTIKFIPHPPARSNENQIINPKLRYIRGEYSNNGDGDTGDGSKSPISANKMSNIVTSDDEDENQLLSSFSPTSLNMILQTQSPKNDNVLIKNTSTTCHLLAITHLIAY
jgi:hypothetical protein